jgi:hypothetical protein
MTRVGGPVEKGETLVFMKVVIDAEHDTILGAAILGVGGDEGDPRHPRYDDGEGHGERAAAHRAHSPDGLELIPTVLAEAGPASP